MKLLIHDYGGYAFTLQLAEYIAITGHEVEYIHGGSTQAVQRFRTNNSCPASLNVTGITLSKPFAKYSFVQRWWQEQEYARLLSGRILDEKPDVTISANAPLDAQRQAWQASRKLHIPFVFWWQDVIGIATTNLLAQKYGLAGQFIGRYYQNLERNLLYHSDRVIAISDKFLPIAKKWNVAPEKTCILPNWAPLKDIPVLPKNNPWAKTYGLVDKFVFLYAGILGLKHNPHTLLSLAEYFRNTKDVVVIVVSEGPGANWLREQKKTGGLENLVVLSFQPYEEFASVLASADVLLAVLDEQAGKYSVPSKVLSYLCARRPVLLSTSFENDAAKMITDHELGLVAHPQSESQLHALAQKLYQEKDLRNHFGKNARSYAEKTFDIQIIAQNFLEML